MRIRWIGLAAMVLAAAAALLPGAPAEEKAKDLHGPENLLANGDFEKGKDSPDGWQQVDGLTTFWVDDPAGKRGKVIKIDTDVLQDQGYEWWAKIARGAKPKDAPKKLPTVEPKYDTLAGLDGVWYWSDFIPVKKGQDYWFTVDIKGTPDVMAWLVGYEKKESNAFGADANAFQGYLKEQKQQVKGGKPAENKRLFNSFINTYVYRGQLNTRYAKLLPDGWRRMSRKGMPFNPTRKTPKVRFVRVLLLPYWPPGVCYIDNVRVTEYRAK